MSQRTPSATFVAGRHQARGVGVEGDDGPPPVGSCDRGHGPARGVADLTELPRARGARAGPRSAPRAGRPASAGSAGTSTRRRRTCPGRRSPGPPGAASPRRLARNAVSSRGSCGSTDSGSSLGRTASRLELKISGRVELARAEVLLLRPPLAGRSHQLLQVGRAGRAPRALIARAGQVRGAVGAVDESARAVGREPDLLRNAARDRVRGVVRARGRATVRADVLRAHVERVALVEDLAAGEQARGVDGRAFRPWPARRRPRRRWRAGRSRPPPRARAPPTGSARRSGRAARADRLAGRRRQAGPGAGDGGLVGLRDPRVGGAKAVVDGHFGLLSGASSAVSRARARARRERTVPTATPVTVAISS